MVWDGLSLVFTSFTELFEVLFLGLRIRLDLGRREWGEEGRREGEKDEEEQRMKGKGGEGKERSGYTFEILTTSVLRTVFPPGVHPAGHTGRGSNQIQQ